MERRTVLGGLAASLAGAASAAVAALCAVFVRDASRPSGHGGRWVAVCSLSEIPDDAPAVRRIPVQGVEAWYRYEEQRGVFVIEDEGRPRVLSGRCTHLGCPVSWDEGRGRFTCPCHGGAFDRRGSVLAGPPQRPLQEIRSRVSGDFVEAWIE